MDHSTRSPKRPRASRTASSRSARRTIEGDVCPSCNALQGLVMDEGFVLRLPDIACHRLTVAGQNGGELMVCVGHGRPLNRSSTTVASVIGVWPSPGQVRSGRESMSVAV